MKNERPPDEAWWERELHRNEKLTDRYLAVLAEHPDLSRLRLPEEPKEESDLEGDAISSTGEPDPAESAANPWDGEFDAAASEEEGEPDAEEEDHAFENDPPDNEGYPEDARQARAFAVALLSLEGRKENPGILVLSSCNWLLYPLNSSFPSVDPLSLKAENGEIFNALLERKPYYRQAQRTKFS